MKDRLSVSEFFYSLQGEGRTMGIPSIFLRLGGCNLLCGGKETDIDGELHDGATWRCDTIEVWKKSHSYTFEDLKKVLDEKLFLTSRMIQGVHLIITGGEPLLQQDNITDFIKYLSRTIPLQLQQIEIETNGTIIPSASLSGLIKYWNVSPKLSNSGMSEKSRLISSALNWFAHNDKSIFKFIISQQKDIKEITDLMTSSHIDRRKIWLMPAASSIEELNEVHGFVSNTALQMQVNFCTRLQIVLWNKTVGV